MALVDVQCEDNIGVARYGPTRRTHFHISCSILLPANKNSRVGFLLHVYTAPLVIVTMKIAPVFIYTLFPNNEISGMSF